jgi:hypothetical protein
MRDGKNLVRLARRRVIHAPPGTGGAWRVEPDGRGGWRRVERARCFEHVHSGYFREISPAEFDRRERARNAAPRPKVIPLRRPAQKTTRRRRSSSRRPVQSRGKGTARDDGGGDGDGDPPNVERQKSPFNVSLACVGGQR